MIHYKGKIVVIAGPTASGKSDIALRLAKDINGYIINGDSRQIYKDLNIGTAKPIFDRGNILDGVKHYLYDYVNPKDNYTLYDYQKDVQKILENEKGIPILTGGTGLYIDSVVFNYNLVKNNKNISDLDSKSVEELQSIAGVLINDMNESDRGNKHRLIRTIERGGINREKGKSLNHIYFVLDIEKEILIERVYERVNKMFDMGLLKENTDLLSKGYTYLDRGMNSIGYIEFKEYFEDKISLDEVKEKIFKNTMSYIKRQRTWFRRNKGSIWIDNYEDIYQKASTFILGR